MCYNCYLAEPFSEALSHLIYGEIRDWHFLFVCLVTLAFSVKQTNKQANNWLKAKTYFISVLADPKGWASWLNYYMLPFHLICQVFSWRYYYKIFNEMLHSKHFYLEWNVTHQFLSIHFLLMLDFFFKILTKECSFSTDS